MAEGQPGRKMEHKQDGKSIFTKQSLACQSQIQVRKTTTWGFDLALGVRSQVRCEGSPQMRGSYGRDRKVTYRGVDHISKYNKNKASWLSHCQMGIINIEREKNCINTVILD